jgi:cellobiose transport system permease protein
MAAGAATLTASREARRKKRSEGLWHNIWRSRWAYIFLAPFFIAFFMFNVFPPLYSVYLSFHSWDILSPMKYVGLDNFRRAIQDALLWKGITNGIIFGVMASVPGLSFALAVAYLLDRYARRWRNVFAAAYFSPMVTSAVSVAVVFTMLYSTSHGLINAGIEAVGLPRVGWLEQVWPLRAALAILVVWQWLGWDIIMFTTGLQTIPNDLYESAEVDGANGWQTFWRIAVPSLRPILLFVVMQSTIGILQLFAEPLILSGGGARNIGATLGGRDNAILTVPMYLYELGFRRLRFGYAAAASYVMFVVVLILTLMNGRLVRGRGSRDIEEGGL